MSITFLYRTHNWPYPSHPYFLCPRIRHRSILVPDICHLFSSHHRRYLNRANLPDSVPCGSRNSHCGVTTDLLPVHVFNRVFLPQCPSSRIDPGKRTAVHPLRGHRWWHLLGRSPHQDRHLQTSCSFLPKILRSSARTATTRKISICLPIPGLDKVLWRRALVDLSCLRYHCRHSYIVDHRDRVAEKDYLA